MIFTIVQTYPTRYIDIPCRGERRKEYDSLQAAERCARRWTKRFGLPSQIWADGDYIARVVKDPLDRIWTEVTAFPGERAWL